jgi:uncharacterized protein YceK
MTYYTQTEFKKARNESNTVFCGTIKYIYYNNPAVYSGVYHDVYGLILFPKSCSGESCFGLIVYPIMLIVGIIDLPFSFVADTLMLPYTMPIAKNMNCKDLE